MSTRTVPCRTCQKPTPVGVACKSCPAPVVEETGGLGLLLIAGLLVAVLLVVVAFA